MKSGDQLGPQIMPMGVPERLRVVRDVAGFYPTTHGELTIATDLKDRLDTVAGCAGYLNGILLHQLNANTEDPEAAVRSVTNQIVGYAGKARADKFFLTELDREMRESQTDHRAAMGSAELHSGLGQFVRYHDLWHIAEKNSLDVVPFDPLRGHSSRPQRRDAFDPYTAAKPAPEIAARISDVMSSVPMWRARRVIGTAIDEQSLRQSFWTDRLLEARQHNSARPIAYTALVNLGALRR